MFLIWIVCSLNLFIQIFYNIQLILAYKIYIYISRINIKLVEPLGMNQPCLWEKNIYTTLYFHFKQSCWYNTKVRVDGGCTKCRTLTRGSRPSPTCGYCRFWQHKVFGRGRGRILVPWKCWQGKYDLSHAGLLYESSQMQKVPKHNHKKV